MITNSNILKEKINNMAKTKNISSQIILQNYMFERFLERVSKSKYNENFILKGGLLLSSLFGIDNRTTMDIDTSITGIEVSIESLKNVISEIIDVKIEDNVIFSIIGFSDIMLDDKYNGYKCKLLAKLDNIKIVFSVDIAVGDIITPKEIKYKYSMLFENRNIILQTYNIETIIAEKFETIITKGIGNSRMKDYYDFYSLYSNSIGFKMVILKEAIKNTFNNRNSLYNIDDLKNIIKDISESELQKKFWDSYSKKYSFASNISFNEILIELNKLVDEL